MPKYIIRIEKGQKKAALINLPIEDTYMIAIATRSI